MASRGFWNSHPPTLMSLTDVICMFTTFGKVPFAYKNLWRNEAPTVCCKEAMDQTTDATNASNLQSQGVHLTVCN